MVRVSDVGQRSDDEVVTAEPNGQVMSELVDTFVKITIRKMQPNDGHRTAVGRQDRHCGIELGAAGGRQVGCV